MLDLVSSLSKSSKSAYLLNNLVGIYREVQEIVKNCDDPCKLRRTLVSSPCEVAIHGDVYIGKSWKFISNSSKLLLGRGNLIMRRRTMTRINNKFLIFFHDCTAIIFYGKRLIVCSIPFSSPIHVYIRVLHFFLSSRKCQQFADFGKPVNARTSSWTRNCVMLLHSADPAQTWKSRVTVASPSKSRYYFAQSPFIAIQIAHMFPLTPNYLLVDLRAKL